MAESSEAVSAHSADTPFKFSVDSFSFIISTDEMEVSPKVVKEVVCKTVTTLGALYLNYEVSRPIIETAVEKAFGGERDDQQVQDMESGSLHVRLNCFAYERFLEVLADLNKNLEE